MIKLPGRDLRFSNDSHMVAVWDDARLTVYMFLHVGPGAYLDRGFGMQMDIIASSPLHVADGGSAIVHWSADSSAIAWQDDAGIWRWDLSNDAGPSRILDTIGAESAKLRENCAVYLGVRDIKTLVIFPYQMESPGLVGCGGGT